MKDSSSFLVCDIAQKGEKTMMELTINGKVYQFKFGLGFLRDANKMKTQKMPNGLEQETGGRLLIAGIMDGDILALEEALNLANKTEKPRITEKELEDYLEDSETDIDALFEETMYFLKNSNATKKTVASIEQAMEEAMKEAQKEE